MDNNVPDNDRCHAVTDINTRCKLKIAKKKCILCHKHLREGMGREIKVIDNLSANEIANLNDDNYEEQVAKKKREYEEFLMHQRGSVVSENKKKIKAKKQLVEDDDFLAYDYPVYEIPDIPNISAYKNFNMNKNLNKIKTKLKPVIPEEILIPLDPVLNYECQCCFTEYPYVELIGCSKTSEKYKHLCCTDCIRGYVEAGITDKKASCSCMMDTKDSNCNGTYCEDAVIKCLPEQLQSQFKDMLIVAEITSFAKLFDNYKICPFCNMFGLTVEGNIKYVECKRCSTENSKVTWCVMCKKAAHGNDPCWKIKDETDVDAIVHTVTETITNALTHKCPKCFTEYIKEEGCNLITCSACHSYSCYLCGISITPRGQNGDQKYWHFYGEGTEPTAEKTCKLFNNTGQLHANLANQGNNKYNNDKVVAACIALLNVNSPKVQYVMKAEMKKHGIDLAKSVFNNKLNLPNIPLTNNADLPNIPYFVNPPQNQPRRTNLPANNAKPPGDPYKSCTIC